MATAPGTAAPTTSTRRVVQCIVCNRQVSVDYHSYCLVCHTDNAEWSRLTWRSGIHQIPAIAWVISVLIILAWLHVAGIVRRTVRGVEISWPALGIAVTVALCLVLVLMMGVFLLRFQLRQYELLRPYKKGGHRPGLILMAITSISGAVFLSLVSAVIAQSVDIPDVSGAPAKALPVLCLILYSLQAPLLVLGVLLLGAKGFIHNFAQRFPDPIYMDTERLRGLLQSTVEAYLDHLRRRQGAAQVVSVSRNHRGGLDLTVQQEVEVEKKIESGDTEYVSQIRTFVVSSDEWGHILSFEEKHPGPKPVL